MMPLGRLSSMAIIVIMWASGMVAARRRGLPRSGQMVFTGSMLALLLIDLWPLGAVPHGAQIPAAFWLFFFAAMPALIGWSLHRRGLTRAFIPLALGLSAVWLGMMYGRTLG